MRIYRRENHVNQEIMSAQTDMLKTYCRAQKYKVVAMVIKFGFGAMSRKYIDRFVETSGPKSVDEIVVSNFSRATRNPSCLINLLEKLGQKNIRLISLDDTVVESRSALWIII